MLDLQHVRTFVVVAMTCNFTRAAKQLGCSQPTVTLHIMTLERQLGAVLFERKRFSKSHVLTTAGRQVYDYAVKLLKLADEIPAAVEKLSAAGLAVPPPVTPTRPLEIKGHPEEPTPPGDLTLVGASRIFIRHSTRHKSLKL